MTKQELKELACKAIDKKAEEIIAIGEKILAHPEMGYREFDTAALVKSELEKLSIKSSSHERVFIS